MVMHTPSQVLQQIHRPAASGRWLQSILWCGKQATRKKFGPVTGGTDEFAGRRTSDRHGLDQAVYRYELSSDR